MNLDRDTDEVFIDKFKSYLSAKYKSDIAYSIEKYTALPSLDEFMRFFFDAEKDTLKNTELFKSRIMGLVSFYRTFKKRFDA